MPKIILTRGIQGSGKTTWAKKWTEEDPEHRVRWNNDDFRRMLGKYWVPKREVIVSSTELHFINDVMCYGYDIVIDNMNLNPKYYEFVKKIIEDFNYMVTEPEQYTLEFKDFVDISLEECIERDSKRENPIGEDIITNTYNKHKDVIENIKNGKL